MTPSPPRSGPAGADRPLCRTGRYVAVEVLCRLQRERCPVKALLDRQAKTRGLSELDRGLAMELVFGVLRHRQVLERMVALLSRTPPAKIEPFVMNTLSVGLYQLFFLDRIPPPAAVHAMVEVAKGHPLPTRLQGFINGILRQALRQREQLPLAAAVGADGQPLLNHPPWLVTRWRQRYGDEETARICRSNNEEPLLVLCTNTAKTGRDELLALLRQHGLDATPGRYAPQAIALPGYRGRVADLPGYGEGFFQVQDEAAQLATLLLLPLRRGGRYVDACAGVGGKTTLLLQHASRLDVEVHAVEPDALRRGRLGENVARLGLGEGLSVHGQTLQEFASSREASCDGIFLDAPCSGTGVIGRQPDIRWNRRRDDLALYQRQQLELLEAAAPLLADGGTLVYATCSLEPEEDLEVVATFLEGHRDFCRDDCAPLLPEEARHLVVDGCFQPRPERTIDGFFAARLRRCTG